MVWLLLAGVLGWSAPLTTRETGIAVGVVGGTDAGSIIGNAVGHPGAGAAVGGALALGAGALIGDQIQALKNGAIGAGHAAQFSQGQIESQRQEMARLTKETKKTRRRLCFGASDST